MVLFSMQASTMIVAGLGVAAFGFGARFMLRTIPNLGQKMANAAVNIPKIDSEVSWYFLVFNCFLSNDCAVIYLYENWKDITLISWHIDNSIFQHAVILTMEVSEYYGIKYYSYTENFKCDSWGHSTILNRYHMLPHFHFVMFKLYYF